MSQGITEMLPISTTIPRNWRFPGISEGENRAIRQTQTQLSAGPWKDAEEVTHVCAVTWGRVSRIVSHRSHQTFHFSFRQAPVPPGEAVLPPD